MRYSSSWFRIYLGFTPSDINFQSSNSCWINIEFLKRHLTLKQAEKNTRYFEHVTKHDFSATVDSAWGWFQCLISLRAPARAIISIFSSSSLNDDVWPPIGVLASTLSSAEIYVPLQRLRAAPNLFAKEPLKFNCSKKIPREKRREKYMEYAKHRFSNYHTDTKFCTPFFKTIFMPYLNLLENKIIFNNYESEYLQSLWAKKWNNTSLWIKHQKWNIFNNYLTHQQIIYKICINLSRFCILYKYSYSESISAPSVFLLVMEKLT